MSKIALSAPIVGAGTATIKGPETATDIEFQLPPRAGQVLVAGPAFSAYRTTGQTVTSNLDTVVQLVSEHFDTNSAFDTGTYRFQPQVAGYYQFSFGVGGIGNVGSVQVANAFLLKNGSVADTFYYNGASWAYPVAANEISSTGSLLLYLNGSTDYVQLGGKVIATNPSINRAFLTGHLVRPA